jgi:hypothetical protein
MPSGGFANNDWAISASRTVVRCEVTTSLLQSRVCRVTLAVSR